MLEATEGRTRRVRRADGRPAEPAASAQWQGETALGATGYLLLFYHKKSVSSRVKGLTKRKK
jgi:hypothetical protein